MEMDSIRVNFRVNEECIPEMMYGLTSNLILSTLDTLKDSEVITDYSTSAIDDTPEIRIVATEDWIYDRLPDAEDIRKNGSEIFLTIARLDPIPRPRYFMVGEKIWRNELISNNQAYNIIAWMPLPWSNYKEISEKSTIGDT